MRSLVAQDHPDLCQDLSRDCRLSDVLASGLYQDLGCAGFSYSPTEYDANDDQRIFSAIYRVEGAVLGLQ